MKRNVALTVLTAILGLGLLFPQPAAALSCAPPDPVEEEMAESSVVFMGKVVTFNSDGQAVFQVEQAWKGVEEPTIEVSDNFWDPYQEGERYLVFAAEEDGKLKRHLCGRTGVWDAEREAAMKEADVEPVTTAAFQPPQLLAADPQSVESAPQPQQTRSIIFISLFLGIVVAGLLVFRFTRSRR